MTMPHLMNCSHQGEGWCLKCVKRMHARLAAAKKKVTELEASFDLRWDADMRAIRLWQLATGEKMTWPDHADLCCWLLGELEKAREKASLDLQK